MTNTAPDTKLETELQEVYMQATHWLQDISFLETETQFFRNIIKRYQPPAAVLSRREEFDVNIQAQDTRLAELKTKIPEFMAFLEPFIGDSKKVMNLDFLDRYNALQNELEALFNALQTTKKELFHYTESLMSPVNPSANLNPIR
ncbi:hypothetical protein [Mucilaginibacter sp.]|uniref:hypothetical protein n=1 Tax=Mucilaginibacter sp. TaxID=1882438 RepID=UPI0035693598